MSLGRAQAFSDPAARAYLDSLSVEQRAKALVFASPARVITKGAFLEAEIAPQQLALVAESGIAACLATWQTWLLDDGTDAPIVGHLNGAVAQPWTAVEALYGGVANGAGQRWQRESHSARQREGERTSTASACSQSLQLDVPRATTCHQHHTPSDPSSDQGTDGVDAKCE